MQKKCYREKTRISSRSAQHGRVTDTEGVPRRACEVGEDSIRQDPPSLTLSRVFGRVATAMGIALVVAAMALLAPRSRAESGSKTVSVTVPIACSLGTDASNHTYSLTVASGQIASGVGGTRMSAYCNDNNGYTIYAIGASGGTDGDTTLINTADSSYTIATGTTTSGTTSSWAMRLTPGTGTGDGSTTPVVPEGYQTYFAVPNSYTAVASMDSSTSKDANAATTGAYVAADYQIYIGTTEHAGTYLGTVKYAMLHPNTENAPKDLETVLADAYQAGTLDESDKVAITDSTTGQTKSYYKMQSLTSTLCSAVNVYGEASQTQMIDARDNKIYWVTKLEDNHCWMTENLDLDLESDTSATDYIALTSENTDLNEYGANNYTTANGYTCSNASTTTNCTAEGEVITWLPERTTIATDALSSSTWTNSYTDPYSYDPGDGDAVDTTMNNAGAGNHGLTGNYYNWTAAIASNASNNFTSSTYSNLANNPKNSVCPKGWRLPTISNASGEIAGSTNEFRRLNVIYNENKTTGSNSGMAWTQSPLYFPRAGYVDGGSLYNRGGSGYYWSSTVNNSTYAYNLYFNSGAVRPEYHTYYRGYGFSVRCVLR